MALTWQLTAGAADLGRIMISRRHRCCRHQGWGTVFVDSWCSTDLCGFLGRIMIFLRHSPIFVDSFLLHGPTRTRSCAYVSLLFFYEATGPLAALLRMKPGGALQKSRKGFWRLLKHRCMVKQFYFCSSMRCCSSMRFVQPANCLCVAAKVIAFLCGVRDQFAHPHCKRSNAHKKRRNPAGQRSRGPGRNRAEERQCCVVRLWLAAWCDVQRV
jgi:hypothetical protein